jgi:hypothetical protein
MGVATLCHESYPIPFLTQNGAGFALQVYDCVTGKSFTWSNKEAALAFQALRPTHKQSPEREGNKQRDPRLRLR